MKKRLSGKKLLSLALAVLAVTSLLATATFVKAFASDDVSPTDTTQQTAPEEIPEDTQEDIPEDIQEIQPEEITESAEEPAEEPAVRTVTVTRGEQDFILSNQTGLKREHGTNYNKFLSSASYNGNYRSELTDKEKVIYDKWVYDTATLKKDYTETTEVIFDPPITYPAPNCTKDPYNSANDVISDADVAHIDDMILSAAAAFFYDRPDVFWLRSFGYTLYVDLSDDGHGSLTGSTSKIVISYSRNSYPGAYGDLNEFQSGIAAAKTEIANSRVNNTPYETVKAIHDYILLHAAYNYDALGKNTYTYGQVYSAAPLFVSRFNGLFVCEGYSKAMKILCNEFGINCALVSGTGMTSDASGGPHMWCYVQLGGSWYAVDATWDDGKYRSDGTPYYLYDYFLVGSGTWVTSNKKFSQNHINEGQVMSSNMTYPLVFPTLSATMYSRYVVDTEPFIDIRTLGAGIRVSDPYGLRFGIQVRKNANLNTLNCAVEFGTLIIPSNILGDDELTITTPMVRKIAAQKLLSQDDNQFTFTGVLIDIPPREFPTEMTGRGYFIYTDSSGIEHIAYSASVKKSFYSVASAALQDYQNIENPNDSQKAMIQKLKAILNVQ